MTEGVVLSLCDKSGVMVLPWAEAGYKCLCVDLQSGDHLHKNIRHVRADVLHYLPPLQQYKIVFAFPPCTNTAVSGARYFRDKGLKGLGQSIALIERCQTICRWSRAPWMVEHPVSVLSSYWRQPDAYFNPAEYAGHLDNPMEEAYTKKTCLWTGRGFVVPERWPRKAVLGSKMHKMAPSDHRADDRARTAYGFSIAVFEANY